MSSPRSASTTASTATHRPPRVKSSAALAGPTAGAPTPGGALGKPKRNKSSSSLSSHHHHAVSFTTHTRKHSHGASTAAAARAAPGTAGKPRKGGFDFGFTKLDPPVAAADAVDDIAVEDEDEEQIDARILDHDRAARQEGSDEQGQGRGRDTTRSPSRSRSRGKDQATSQARGREHSRERGEDGERERSRARDRSIARERLLNVNPPVLSTPTAAVAGSIGSDWISATDSPAPIVKQLAAEESRVSGLGHGFDLGDTAPLLAAAAGRSRAIFELGDHDSATPPPASPMVPEFRSNPRPPSPPLQSIPLPATVSAPSEPPVSQQSTIPFPTTTSQVQPAAVKSAMRPTASARKSSSASLLSLASIRSLMGPPPPGGLRRTSGRSELVLPAVMDRNTIAAGVVSASTGNLPELEESRRGLTKHSRSDSMTSLRSIAESSPASLYAQRPGAGLRSSTMGNRVRERNALDSLSNVARTNSLAELSAGGAGEYIKKSASGYFNSLRELAMGAVGVASSTTSSAGDSSAGPNSPLSPRGAGPPSSRLPPSASSASLNFLDFPHSARARFNPTYIPPPPLISKFIEPLDPNSLAYLATPPTVLKALPTTLHEYDINSAGGGGPMSRTQQKALLARDTPFPRTGAGNMGGQGHHELLDDLSGSVMRSTEAGLANGGATGAAGGGSSQYYTQAPALPASAISSPQTARLKSALSPAARPTQESTRSIGMQKWAAGLIREAERIERSAKAVEKWRDPIGESLGRVLS